VDGAEVCSGFEVLPDDSLCDGTDNDCDGQTDEDYGAPVICQGVCQGAGRCVRGQELCLREPEGDDADCNGLDDDCDGEIDERYVSEETCGLGECLRSEECVDGRESCTPAEAQVDEEVACDGRDEDCDGETDGPYDVGVPCSTGVGACLRHGVKVCTADGTGTECGVEPGDPRPETCNGEDDDCDELTDNGAFVPGVPCHVSVLPHDGLFLGIDVAGDLVAAVNEHALNLFLLEGEAPEHTLRLVTRWPTGGQAYDVRLVDGTAYVADGLSQDGTQARLVVVDVEDPEHPALLTTVTTDCTGAHRGHQGCGGDLAVARRRHRAFLTAGTGVAVVDITDPASAQVVGRLENTLDEEPQRVQRLAVPLAEDTLWTGDGAGQLVSYDIPGGLEERQRLRLDDGIHGITPTPRGDALLVSTSDDVVVVTVEEGRMEPRGSVGIDRVGGAGTGDLAGTVVLGQAALSVGYGTRRTVLDFSDPDWPEVLAELEASDRDEGVVLHGTTALIAARRTVAAVSLADLHDPVPAGRYEEGLVPGYDHPPGGRSVILGSLVAGVSDEWNAAGIVDLSDFDHPEYVGGAQGAPLSVEPTRDGEVVYVAEGEAVYATLLDPEFGFEVAGELDLWPLDTPSALTALPDAGRLLVGTLEGAVLLVDTSVPDDPGPVLDEVELGGRVDQIVVEAAGRRAFAARRDSRLCALDLSDPDAIASLGCVDRPGSHPYGGLALVDGGPLLAAGRSDGVLLFDVSDEGSPPELADDAWECAAAADVAAYGEHVYVANGLGGLQVVDFGDPLAPVLLEEIDTPGRVVSVTTNGRILVAGEPSDTLFMRLVPP